MPELKDIEIDEISFVTKPANNKRFIFYKGADAEMDGSEVDSSDIKLDDKSGEVVNEQSDGVEGVTSEDVEKKISDKVIAAVESAISELKSVRRSLPSDVKRVISVLEEFLDSANEGMAYGYSYPNPKSKSDMLDGTIDIIKGMLARSNERLEELTKLADEFNRRLTALELVKTSDDDVEVVKVNKDGSWPSLSGIF